MKEAMLVGSKGQGECLHLVTTAPVESTLLLDGLPPFRPAGSSCFVSGVLDQEHGR